MNRYFGGSWLYEARYVPLQFTRVKGVERRLWVYGIMASQIGGIGKQSIWKYK